ncbi:methyltransferase domain-containing protein [Nocardia terpenica]|uniref:Methyltransferase domain-containing protein n=2 Tax=Nocardia terpenica TaxID=455432 RepID=A0A6G9ZDJ5_9NOCA|nr:methyltransferase domain-containing protein [Nocardia terpenica]
MYEEDPQVWRKVLGDSLFFHHGIYKSADTSLEEAAVNYLEAQLMLAGFASSDVRVERILDIGCGWGGVLAHLARKFPACHRLDGLNISSSQLTYACQRLYQAGIGDRVRLYLCNAQDITLLPDPDWDYDLAIARGSVAHFTFDVLDDAIAGLGRRVRLGGMVIIAEVLYNNLNTYQSCIPDPVDRLGCGYRKSPDQVTDLLTKYGFTVTDLRVLPSDTDAIRWFTEVQHRIDRLFPDGAPLRALQEYHTTASNMVAAVQSGKVATYSIIAQRTPGGFQ